MKEFAIYTGLRAALFGAAFAVLYFPLRNQLSVFPLLLVALLISSILSIFVLRAARDRLAGRISTRAGRISERIEKARAAEDDN
ncbi:DUF4229 domain-containing protein [Kribbella sandramycini]|uniref:DUF4229 domain-containing protein n=1 Tax=Kribbella sandramycini TaxID=60450 RepID=A0A7Y4L3J0_9ACTN|nr:DUF4229 domain-containing protein [Kribbella sandramycini]MBB6564843.1 membrane protein implicated in regulation of membrane protease activity [Kribbella sandramycini]NOL42541.1 DUF4229 domain-containing protein [Kribbella sandramycini]